LSHIGKIKETTMSNCFNTKHTTIL